MYNLSNWHIFLWNEKDFVLSFFYSSANDGTDLEANIFEDLRSDTT